MILTTKQKKIVRTTIFMGILLISGFSAMNYGQLGIEKVPEQVNNLKSIPSSSAFWVNTSITIDATATTNDTHFGNWTWAENQDWCSGFGTPGQPYLIENMTFDVESVSNGLLIQNSVDIYFTINNCKFINALSSGYAGLLLDHTTNGTITNCNATSNYNGIFLDTASNYNNIINNNCSENSYTGIMLYKSIHNVIESNILDNNGDFGSLFQSGCNYNEISFNTVQDNYRSGIFFLRGSNNNTIFNNTLSQNAVLMVTTWGGITIREYSDYNEVYNNTSYQSNIYLDDADHNTIIDNTFESGTNGIHLFTDNYNNSIVNNTIINYDSGFRCSSSNLENKIIDNDFINCNNYGIFLNSAKNFTISDNVITGSDKGIRASGGDNNTLIRNQIFGSITSDIEIKESNNWNLTENTMETKGLLITDIYHNQIDTSNTVQGKPIYYYEDQNDLDLDGDIITNIGQLFVINSNNSVISNFNFNNLPVGLYIDGGNNLSISNNNVSNNNGNGMYLKDLSQSSITGNIAFNNLDYGMELLNIDQSSITGNTVSDNKYGIYNGNEEHEDWDEDYPDLSLLMGENIFSDNIVNNNERHGIEIRYSKLDTISNNILNNNTRDGLYVEYVYNSSISYNQVRDNLQDGIGVYQSPNATIFENEITNSSSYGIYLEVSNQTKIEKNQISLCYNGIHLYESHQSSIENNEITSNSHHGIYFEITNDTIISGNIISLNNETGITIDSESHNNIIFQNMFIQNTVHAEDNGFTNQWYFQNIGNYWDNYTGSDLDNDGIGDTNHSIFGSANNFDLYPIFDVAPVFIEIPFNVSFTVNQSQVLNWTVQDFIIWDATYTILLNGTEVETGTWESGTQFSFDLGSLNLEPGVYNVTIIVSDGLGYSTQESVLIVINPEIGDEPDPNKISGWLIFLFIVLGLSVVSITSMVVLKKTSPEKYDIVMETLKGFFGKFKNIGKSDKK